MDKLIVNGKLNGKKDQWMWAGMEVGVGSREEG